MRTVRVVLAVLIAVSLPTVLRADRAERIHIALQGFQEVPSVSTPASGSFNAKVAEDGKSFDYVLRFDDLVGTVQQSHIHFAQRGVNGSIVVWLCQTATTPAPASVAALTPTCVEGEDIKGTISAANVITAGTASQQILAGEFDEVLAAIRAGYAYVNVHATPLNPGGEIRGQFRANRGRDGDHGGRK
jgi:hypothetical protein